MPRILLVDDDIAEISAVKRALLRAGHAPALATSAADALAALEGAAPDLVVLAAACDGGEALALARRVAEDPATAHVPMIIVGDADPLPRGARRLPRPVDPVQLQEEVAARLGAAAPAPRAAATPPAASARPAPPSAAGADPAAARRAAAEALRARAEELRRSGGGPAVPAPPPRAAATAAAPAPASPKPAARPAGPAAPPAARAAQAP
ncbi:molecular chaperone DnaJ, partial [Anaeromyxobacter sp. Red801]